MHKEKMRRALSLFLAFALIFTCNNAVYQPLFAMADDVPEQGDGLVATAGELEKAVEPFEEEGTTVEGGVDNASSTEPLSFDNPALTEREPADASPTPASASGIAHAASFDQASGRIVWTIELGADSPGADLSSSELTWSYDESQLDLAAVYLGSASGGADVTSALRHPETREPLAVEAADGAVALPLSEALATARAVDHGASVAAPCVVTVVAVPSGALRERATGEPVTVTATAKLSVPNASGDRAANSFEARASVDVALPASNGAAEPQAADRATPAPAAALEAGSDVTEDTNQLKLAAGSLTYRDKNGVVHPIDIVTDAQGNQTVDLSSIPLESIDTLNMRIDFSILKDDEGRNIEAGDFYRYTLDSRYFIVTDAAGKITAQNGVELGEYSIVNNVVTVTFSQAVNLDEGNQNIRGGCECEFRLNADGLDDENPSDIDLDLQGDGGSKLTIVAPPKTPLLGGIEKTGAFNKQDSTITWSIVVGKGTPGVPLAGVQVIDTLGEGLVLDRATVQGEEFAFSEEDGHLVGAFPADSALTAPQTIEVTTSLTEEALKRASEGGFAATNEATLPPQKGRVSVPAAETSSDRVPVDTPSLTKHGSQLDANTIHYDIAVNEDGSGSIYDAVVTDALGRDDAGNFATLKADEQGRYWVTVDGVALEAHTSLPVPDESTTYVTYLQTDGLPTIEVHFKNAATNDLLAEAHRISFDAAINLVDDEQKDADLNFQNAATLDGRWPIGTGPGPSFEHRMPAIGTDFQVAYVSKEATGADPRTGVVSWSITPSTRTDGYDGWVIEDVIGASWNGSGYALGTYTAAGGTVRADQTYEPGSLAVWCGGEDITDKCIVSEDAFAVGGVPTTKLSVSIDPAKDDGGYAQRIGEIVVTLDTKAVNYLHENAQNHTYANAAHLGVQKSGRAPFNAYDNASKAFPNTFLQKTASFEAVDGSAPGTSDSLLRFKLTVNASKMDCAGLEVEDDLGALASDILDAGGSVAGALDASDWDVEGVSVTRDGVPVSSGGGNGTWGFAGKKFSAHIGATSSTYEIELAVKLNAAGKAKLIEHDGCTVATKNTAWASDANFDGGNACSVDFTTDDKTGSFANDVVGKSGSFAKGTDSDPSYIVWTVQINALGSELHDAKVTDVLPDSLELDYASVKVYYAKHNADGSIASDHGGEVPGCTVGMSLSDDGKTQFEVSLPNGSESYVLEYRTNVVDLVDGGGVSNHAVLSVDGQKRGEDTAFTEVKVDSWGWLDATALLRLVKQDEFGGAQQPLKGVVFELYKDPAFTQLFKTGVSRDDGTVPFYGLAANTTYYYKETSAPVGYSGQVLEGDLTTGDAGKANAKDVAVTNARKTTDGLVEVSKTFDSPGNIANPVSEFKLWLYPDGYGNAKKVPVGLTGGDGAYAFDRDASPDGVVASKASDGSIKIADLPWGCYALEETSPQGGYAAYEGMKYFEVTYGMDDQGSDVWGVNYDPRGTGVDTSTIDNEKTALEVVKTSPSGTSLTGAVLSVYETDAAGNKGSDIAKSPFDGNPFTATVTDPDTQTFTWSLAGLPAGTYVLAEDQAPDDPRLVKFQDVKFSVDAYGKARVLSGPGAVDGKAIKVSDGTAPVKLAKLDQFGVRVQGAKVELQRQNGSSWETVEAYETAAGTDKSVTVARDAKYRFVETEVPGGHLAVNDGALEPDILACVEFSIDEFGKMTVLDLHNPAGLDANTAYGNAASAGSKTVTMRNERIVGHASFEKTDDNGTPLKDVRFDLYRVGAAGDGSDDAKVNRSGSFSSGADGMVTTKGSSLVNDSTGEPIGNGLAPGSYYFKEVATHDDFVLPQGGAANTPAFTVEADGSNRYTWQTVGANAPWHVVPVYGTGALSNTPLDAAVVANKVGTVGGVPSQPLPGATFKLSGTTSSGASYTRTVVSASADGAVNWKDSNNGDHSTPVEKGQAVFVNVPAGTYTVTETVPAPGYALNAGSYPVTVTADAPGQVHVVGDGAAGSRVVANELTAFKLDKVDAETGMPVNDVELSVFQAGAPSSDPALAVWKRSASGDVSATALGPTMSVGPNNELLGLPAGSYVLKETKTPSVYATAADIPFTLKPDGSIESTTLGAVSGSVAGGITITMKDRLAKAQVELAKTIEGGAPGTVRGTEFSLCKGDGTLLAEHLAIGASGTWSSATAAPPLSDGLEVGDYYFVETKATDDTVLDARHWDFSVTNADDYRATGTPVAVSAVNAPFSASLVLDKLDGTSGEALAGAEFTLSYQPASGGSVANTVLTSADGRFAASNLKKGVYTLTETTVPVGYRDAFSATFELTEGDSGKTVEVNEGTAAPGVVVTKTGGTWTGAGVTNTRIPGSMTLTKVEEGTAVGLGGAEFELTGPDGSAVTYTTGSDGTLNASDLAWGSYAIAETKAPDGYRLGDAPYSDTFAIDAGNAASGIDLGSVGNAETRVSIAKTDDGGSPLAGAHLKLSGRFAGTADSDVSWTSGTDPREFAGELIVGETYTLTESDRLSGYLTWSDVVTFKLNDAGAIEVTGNPDLRDGSPAASVSSDGLRLSLRNVAVKADVELTKTRDGAGPLEGVVFDLYQQGASSALRSGLATDPDGKIRVEGLPEGSYYFVETAAPDDAVIDRTHRTFSVGEAQHGTTVDVLVDNASFHSSVSVCKVDETSGEPLAGAQFALSKSDGAGGFVAVGPPVSTNEFGMVAFALTEKGTYRVQETQAAPGYALDADNPYTATFTVENTADFQGEELELREDVGQATVDKYRLSVENVLYRDGNVANERKLGSVSLQKVDAETNAALDDVEFELYDAADPGTVLGTFETGRAYASPADAAGSPAASGVLDIAGLTWGDYYLQETRADSYRVLGDKLAFSVGSTNADQTPSVDLGAVRNDPIEFGFAKVEQYVESCSDPSLGAEDPAALRPLEDAEFTIYRDPSLAQPVDAATSGVGGQVRFDRVPAGTYYVHETTVPDGRVSDGAVYELVIAADGTIERFAPVGGDGVLTQVVNDVHRADIHLKKVSETDEGKVLPGSTYGLYKRAPVQASADPALAGGLQLIAKAVTDADGRLAFEGVVMDQEYVICELEAPDGCLVSKNPVFVTFALGDDGVPKVVAFDDGSGTAKIDEDGVIVWNEPQVTVLLEKKDPEGNLLAGAKLQVVDQAGVAVGEPWTSSSIEGRTIEGELAAGKTYRLQELEPPSGYLKADDVTFTVENPRVAPGEDHVQRVEMTDQRVPAPAKAAAHPAVRTGDPWAPFIPVIAGAAVVAAIAIAAAIIIRRRNRN